MVWLTEVRGLALFSAVNIPPSSKFPNRRALCANNVKLYYLKDCEILSMEGNSFGIATNSGLAVINEACNAMDVEFKWPGSVQCSD